ncbi:MAG: PorT family protein [Prevotellaceae bacterium]|nr:PorT family protein [Prevotellaceae bacterium]
MTRIGLYILLIVSSTDLCAQVCREKQKPYFSVWGEPRSVSMNLLDREYSRSIHFGFSMGVNAFDFSNIKTSRETVFVPGQGNAILTADLVHIKLGFSLNAIADYRLTRNLNLRFTPGIFFGNRQLNFYRTDTQGLIQSMPISSNYLEFPLTLKYSANRYSNFRPYILTGLTGRINFNNGLNPETERYIAMIKFEPFADVGIGFDFYFNYFRMSTEFKLSTGLINCLHPAQAAGFEHFRQSLTSMRSNTLSFCINFEL